MSKKPKAKFRVNQLVEYNSSDARSWLPAKVKSVSYQDDEEWTGWIYEVSPDDLWCIESEIRLPKVKRLPWKKFVEKFRSLYKKSTKKAFPTFKEMVETRHPDLMGLAEAHEEGWSPEKAVKSYLDCAN